jgi:hypothetical protein
MRIREQDAKSMERSRLRSSSLSRLLVIMILVLSGSGGHAQTMEYGRVMGKIVHKETGEPLIGAVVLVEGTKLGAQADLDGNYLINNVPVGSHRLKVQAVGYATLIVEQVAVAAGQANKLDFSN